MTYFLVVEESYSGPHLGENNEVTFDFVEKMKEHFKNQKLIHKKYALQILIQAKTLFR